MTVSNCVLTVLQLKYATVSLLCKILLEISLEADTDRVLLNWAPLSPQDCSMAEARLNKSAS
jgi:hypothetical protein